MISSPLLFLCTFFDTNLITLKLLCLIAIVELTTPNVKPIVNYGRVHT